MVMSNSSLFYLSLICLGPRFHGSAAARPQIRCCQAAPCRASVFWSARMTQTLQAPDVGCSATPVTVIPDEKVECWHNMPCVHCLSEIALHDTWVQAHDMEWTLACASPHIQRGKSDASEQFSQLSCPWLDLPKRLRLP